MKSLLLAVLVSLIKVDDVIGEYEVEVRVHSYHNPTGRCDECQEDHSNSDRPGCCDEERDINTCSLQETCDTSVGLCIRPLGSTGTNCAGIVNGTTIEYDTNYLDFESSPELKFFGLSNPILMVNRRPWMGLQLFFLIVDCSSTDSDDEDKICNIIKLIDAIPVDIDITVGTASPETTYVGLAGIAQLDVSFLVRCTDNFYGHDCLTSCPDFESCAECGLSRFTGEFCQFSTEDCSEVYCNGNGDCVDGNSACDCNPGFTGDLCHGDRGSSVGAVAGGVTGALIGVILIMLIIIILIVVITVKAKSGSKDSIAVNCQENPVYYVHQGPPETLESGRNGDSEQERAFENSLYAVTENQTPDSGRNGLATDSVRERELKNPLYVVSEDRNSTMEGTDPPNIYDQVDSQPENIEISPDPSAIPT